MKSAETDIRDVRIPLEHNTDFVSTATTQATITIGTANQILTKSRAESRRDVKKIGFKSGVSKVRLNGLLES